jgi:hypothetical protein
MSDISDSSIHPLEVLADRVAKDAATLSREVHMLGHPDGSSPVIISDGSLMITSIADPISGPFGGGPYSYTMSKKALVKVRHCTGIPSAAQAGWKLVIPELNTGAKIELSQTGSVLTISGVPNAAPAPLEGPPSEYVLTIQITPDWANAYFYPDGISKTNVKHHLALHFSNAD